jgi:hypothetical protein
MILFCFEGSCAAAFVVCCHQQNERWGLLIAFIGPSRTGLSSAQLPRIGFVLFLDKKNQKSSQKRGFFAALAFALQGR